MKSVAKVVVMTRLRMSICALIIVVAVGLSHTATSHVAHADALVTMPSGCATQAQSATGRQPRTFWTPERQAVWNCMKQKNDPWWQLMKRYADRSQTSERRSGDIGQWSTLVYQITGDVQFARKAWDALTTQARITDPATGQKVAGSFLNPSFRPADGRNFTREAFVDFVWMYDWLYPALTPAERETFYTQLNQWADWVLNKTKVDGITWGTRLTDSDETTGHYFGLAMIDLATYPDNPRAGTFLKENWNEEIKSLPVGGLDATAADFSSMRNAIRRYVELAEGGQWIESSEYNLGTLRMLLAGAEAVQTAVCQQTNPNYPCKDYFPEIKRYASQAAVSFIQEMTPDLTQSYQWGDVESGRMRNIDLHARSTILGVLEGYTQHDANAGPLVHQAIEDLTTKYVHALTYGGKFDPSPTFYIFYNPYLKKSDWRSTTQHASTGRGLFFSHAGWQPNDSFFGAHFAPFHSVDHSPEHFGNFQLYRKGEWAITHMLGYTINRGSDVNGMQIYGLSAAAENKGAVAYDLDSNNKYAYVAGSTGGHYYRQPNHYDPPETFLHEWTRSLLYLSSENKKSDTIVVFDRIHVEPPKRLHRYLAGDRERINTAQKQQTPLEWILHMPVSPTINGAIATWQTPSNQSLRLETLLPANPKHTIVNETEVWPGKQHTVPEEKKYHVRISPSTQSEWTTFLNVIQATDESLSTTNQLVRSDDALIEGSLISRPDTKDVLALFSAKPSPKRPATWQGGDDLKELGESRLITQSYRLHLTARTAETDVYAADLDPSKQWKATVNGQSTPLSVNDQGLGKFVLSSPGPQTIEIIANDAKPVEQAAINITKTVDKTTARSGDTLTYVLRYENTSTARATNVKVQDILPTDVTFIQSTPAVTTQNGRNLEWQIGTVPANHSGELTIQVRIQ